MPRMALLFSISMVSLSLYAAPNRLIDFSLEDHGKTLYSSEMWRGRPVVLFLSDRKGSEHNSNYAWTLPLIAAVKGQSFGTSALFASIADLRGTPRLARGFVRTMFEPKREDPVGLTLLDWDGRLFKAYELNPGAFHMLVFDGEGALVYRVALQQFDMAQLSAVKSALEDL